jgi:hypothetical protein
MATEPTFNVIIREADINLLEDCICLEGNEDCNHARSSIIGTYSIGLSEARKLIEAFNAVVNLHYVNSHIHYAQADCFGSFTFLNESDDDAICRVFYETLIIPEKKIGDDIYHGSTWFQFIPKDYHGLVMEFEIPIYAIIKWVSYFDKHENN